MIQNKNVLALFSLLMNDPETFEALKPNTKIFSFDENIILKKISTKELGSIEPSIMSVMLKLSDEAVPIGKEAKDIIYSLYKKILVENCAKLSDKEFTDEYLKSANNTMPKIYRLGDTPMPKQKEYIVQSFLEGNSLNVVYADAGSGKTWLMSHLLHCISKGELFLGQFYTQKAKCLYIDAESGSDEVNRRFLKIDKEARENENIYLTCFEKIPFESVEFIEYIKKENFKFLLIDSLRGISEGRNENAANEIGELFVKLLKFAKKTDTTIMIIHHANKSDNYSGSTAIKGFIDNLFKLELIRGMKTSKQLLIKNVKNRYGYKEDIAYVMKDSADNMIDFQYIDNSQIVDDTLKAILELLYHLSDDEQVDGLTQSEIARAIHKQRPNIVKYFKDTKLFADGKKPFGIVLSIEGIELYQKICS